MLFMKERKGGWKGRRKEREKREEKSYPIRKTKKKTLEATLPSARADGLTAAEPQEGDGLRPASQAQCLRRLWELETAPSPVPAWPVETRQSLRAPGKQDPIKQKGFCTRDFPGLPGSPGMEPHSQFKAGVFSDFSGASSEPRGEDTQLSSLVLPLLHRPLGHLILSVTSQISLLTQHGTGTSQALPAQVLQT